MTNNSIYIVQSKLGHEIDADRQLLRSLWATTPTDHLCDVDSNTVGHPIISSTKFNFVKQTRPNLYHSGQLQEKFLKDQDVGQDLAKTYLNRILAVACLCYDGAAASTT